MADEKPNPAYRRSGIIRDIIIGVVLLLAALWAIKLFIDRGAEYTPANAPAEGSSGDYLISGEGRDNGVSRDFTVPAGCARQNLDYKATATKDVNSNFVHFRAIDADGDGRDNSGVIDVDPTAAGRALFTLPPGQYAMEIEAYQTRWEYDLTCR